MSSSGDMSSGVEVEYVAVFTMEVSSVPELTVALYFLVTDTEPTGEPNGKSPNKHVITLVPESNRHEPKPVTNVSPDSKESVTTSPVTPVLLFISPDSPLKCLARMENSIKSPTTAVD